jgi:hypothetical protein
LKEKNSGFDVIFLRHENSPEEAGFHSAQVAFCTGITWNSPLLNVVVCAIEFVPKFRFMKVNKDSRY